jgi:polyisoprenoid-binding protein YceI
MPRMKFLAVLAFTIAAAAPSAAPVRLVVAGENNVARYRVREQLVGFDLPNDAVGVTKEVTGAIVLDEKGNVVPEQSRIVVGVASLTSDKTRRDGYVRRRLLQADSFPTVEFVVTRVRGVALPLPSSGDRSFALEGNLTVRGITRPTTWRVDATFSPDGLTGTAITKFTFAEFGLTQPRVPVVLSVADTIALEYDFTLRRESVAN